MATDKPRFTITLPRDLYEEMEQFRFGAKIKTQSGAIQALVRGGIAQMRQTGVLPAKNDASSLAEEAMKLVKAYDKLDRAGRRAVKVTIADQRARMEEERKAARSRETEGGEADGPVRVIPLYYTPAAAGYASPAFGDDFEYVEVGGEIPAYADFAVKIDGDSMEPYIRDGGIVSVNRDPLSDGDVGIFYCDGDMLCKQYLRGRDGTVHLLSLNRDRADADRHIPPESGVSLVCYGRVILPRRPAPAADPD